ncbi:MAG: AMP-binding protein [Candidatus Coatesbacteria bacterium]
MLTYKDYLSPEHVKPRATLYDMLRTTCEQYHHKAAFQMRENEDRYRQVTYGQLWDRTEALAEYLLSLGIEARDKVAIESENRPEWGLAYFAIMKTKATIVPIDAQLPFTDVDFILDHSETSVLFVSRGIWEKVWKTTLATHPRIEHVIVFDPVETSDPRVRLLDHCIEEGAKLTAKLPQAFAPNDHHVILYTSGTTGNPKAVMLSHGNLASNVYAIHRIIHFDDRDSFVSVLPVHHVFECTVGLLAAVAVGATVTYAESLKSSSLLANMRETRATLILGVPLLFEKLYYGILRAVEKRPIHHRFVFWTLLWAVRIGRIFGIEAGGLVFRGLRGKAGLGTIRLAISGGGPLPYVTARGFRELGIRLIQGYGLSETSPVLTAGTERHDNVRSVGLPLPGVELRIVDPSPLGEGEIACRGPMVMQGYYRNPEATAAVMQDGWLLTGDAGYLDGKGFLHITGRLKNVIVTHGGKNVYPEELEEKLDASPFIKESLVYGEPESEDIRGEKVAAIIVPDYELIRENWDEMPHARVHREPTDQAIAEEVDRAIHGLNHHLPAYKRITGWAIHREELAKTSTRKIKRFLYKAGRTPDR